MLLCIIHEIFMWTMLSVPLFSLLALCIQIDNVKVRLCRNRGVAGTTGTRHGREQVDQMVKVNSNSCKPHSTSYLWTDGTMATSTNAMIQYFCVILLR